MPRKHRKTNNRKKQKIQTKRNKKTRGGGTCSDFSNLHMRHYYPMNSYSNDVQGGQIASRLQPGSVYGGGNRSIKMRYNRNMLKSMKKRQKDSKKRGGGIISTLGSLANITATPFNMAPNMVTNTGNFSSGMNGANILFGYPTASSSVVSPPIQNYLV
jgi:hypothetical protein